jgi:hypothetical protein
MRASILAVTTTLAVSAAGYAAADPPPPPAERGQVFSRYEQETIDIVLRQLHARRELHPEGKLVERVEIVPLDVIEPRDPAPNFLNIFHATTRKAVVRRELLLQEGQPYRQVLVDDTLRNLRRLPELSLVLVVTVAGSAPDRVVAVVITKDVWSLRLGWDAVGTSGGIEEVDLEPTETNLFGTHQIVRGEYIYQPSAHTFGLGYTVPRLEGSRIAVVASADLMVNRQSGATEGSYGSLVAGEPLYSGVTPWAWDATVAWADIVVRRYQNAQLGVYVDPTTGVHVPYEYRRRTYQATYDVTRSFGWAVKHDFTFAAVIERDVYRTQFSGINPVAVADFVTSSVPLSDTRVGPSVSYHSYARRYLRVLDFETLALQEDFGLGHDVLLRVSPSFRALGSTREFVDIYAAVQYSAAVRDGFARVFVVSDNQPGANGLSDALINPGIRLMSPTIAGLGRIVVDGGLIYRYRNYLNALDTLGGGDRLRGYPTNFFVGEDSVAYNFELRTRPVEIFSCELGGVLFFDAGDAFNGLDHLTPFQSVGFGFRALFPQLDRTVLRADFGFPLERPIDPAVGQPIAPFSFLISFGQAFDVPTIDPVPVLPTGATETTTSATSGQ